jgi:putative addiction module component (TIGR02574 family)
MSEHPKLTELLQLPPEQRLELIEAIWDSLAATPEQVPIPDWHLRIIEERMADDERDPEPGDDWPTVRRRIEGGGA